MPHLFIHDMSVEDLRRKHILTLEALQKLSDENAALKIKLGHGGNEIEVDDMVDDKGREVHKGGGDKAVNELLMAKQNECQALEARVEDLEKNVKGELLRAAANCVLLLLRALYMRHTCFSNTQRQ